MTNSPVANQLSPIEEKLIDAIRTKFERCWQLNDPAHRFDHFMDVYQTAKLINAEYSGEKYGWREMMLVAFFHDLFSWSRINHHSLAEHFLLTTNSELVNEIIEGDNVKLWLAAKACAEHRASFTGTFSTLLSQIMSAADRGMPGTAASKVERSYAYNLDRIGDPEIARREAVIHVKDKFGRQGYARYPEFYVEIFKDDLERLWDEIDAL